ncbi:MAG TPA: hypothetical protein VLJ61_16005 [Pyrinomonadaceae bacterium]|nr:hypothetical protein [Pyrinomonadaceae bacterium]
MNIYFIGAGFGTDAPSWFVGPDGKIHRVPGWNPEAMKDLAHAVNVIREASQIKTAGIAEAAIKSVMDFAQKELGANLKGGGVVVVV